MTTVSDAIHQLRTDYLLTGRREQRNQLLAPVDADDLAFLFKRELRGIQEGARVSVGLEDVYVWSTNPGSKEAEVERGDFGTTATTHDTDDIALVNPRWSDAQVLRALNDELQALSSPPYQLYRIRHVDLTANPVQIGYDLSSSGVEGLLGVQDVAYHSIGPSEDWIRIRHWEYQRDHDANDFPSGHSLMVREAVDPGQTIRVWFKAEFSPLFTLPTALEAASGLPDTALDVLLTGAGIRLILGRETTRNLDDSQGDTRRAEEVPPGANLGGLRAMKAFYDSRRMTEAGRLRHLHPLRR